MSETKKLYAQRDIEQLDEDGNYHFKHMMAMTKEDLYSKRDIAAELGYRDARIAELEKRIRLFRNLKSSHNLSTDIGL